MGGGDQGALHLLLEYMAQGLHQGFARENHHFLAVVVLYSSMVYRAQKHADKHGTPSCHSANLAQHDIYERDVCGQPASLVSTSGWPT